MSNNEISVAEWAQKDGKKQEAINFAEWCDKNATLTANGWIWVGDTNNSYTTDQLYELFKKENP